METTTNRKDFVTWNMNCYECGCEFISYSWNYDDTPIDFCCSDECYEEYESFENRRDRRLKLILKDEI